MPFAAIVVNLMTPALLEKMHGVNAVVGPDDVDHFSKRGDR
jgi:hypothetical protein